MSKKNNVNPDHYKTAGRERQGEHIVHDAYKRQYTQFRSNASAPARNSASGDRVDEHLDRPRYAAKAGMRVAETHRKENRL